MMRTVHLHGRLFGKLHRFETLTAGEVFRALNANFPTRFVEELKLGSYQIIRGRRHGGMHLDKDQLNGFRLGNADLHIVPVVQGSAGGKKKGGGALKAVLGIAIVGAAVFMSGGTLAAPLAGMSTQVMTGMSVTWGNVALLGLSATLLGASSMLAGSKEPAKQEVGRDESFAFSGPGNSYQQGNAIPLVYGLDVIVGSQSISIGIDSVDIAIG